MTDEEKERRDSYNDLTNRYAVEAGNVMDIKKDKDSIPISNTSKPKHDKKNRKNTQSRSNQFFEKGLWMVSFLFEFVEKTIFLWYNITQDISSKRIYYTTKL